MKRDIQINIDHLEAMTKKLASYLGDVAKIRLASQRFLKVLQEQQSTAYQNLAQQWQTQVVESAELLQSRLEETYRLLQRYLSAMGSYIAPSDPSKMMRVDRNDILFNLLQIQCHLENLSFVYNSYYDSPKDYTDWISERRQTTEDIQQKIQREKQYRQYNYNQLEHMKTCLRSEVLQHIDQNLYKLYNEVIVPFENTDDSFATEATALYEEYKTFADGVTDIANVAISIAKGIRDQALGNLDGLYTLLFWGSSLKLLAEIGIFGEDIQDRVIGMDTAIIYTILYPGEALESLGQTSMDTYEKEGLSYLIGNVIEEVLEDYILGKVLGKLLGQADVIVETTETIRKVENILDDAPMVVDELVEGGLVPRGNFNWKVRWFDSKRADNG